MESHKIYTKRQRQKRQRMNAGREPLKPLAAPSELNMRVRVHASSNHGPLALQGIGTYNAVNLLPQAHKLARGRHHRTVSVSKTLVPNRTGGRRGHSDITGKDLVDGMAKENTVAVQLSTTSFRGQRRK